MTRTAVPLLATGMMIATMSCCSPTMAQQPSPTAPDPKMPAMPSMEGQQGDVSKPVTQIPARKKPAAVEKKTPAKTARPARHETQGKKHPRVAATRKRR